MLDLEEGKMETVTFPEELLENIISRFPFPHIFKAKLLSREWRSKFERIAGPSCNHWPSYCPAFFDTRSNYFLGYDRVHNNWLIQKLNTNVAVGMFISLKSLQKPRDGLFWERFPTPCEVEGVMFCRVDVKAGAAIMNLLTGECRRIPYPPYFDQYYWAADVFSCFSSIIVPREADKFQIVLYGMRRNYANYLALERRTFDSTYQTWCSKTLRTHVRHNTFHTRHFAYLDGNMYYICSDRGRWIPACLVQASFEDDTIRELPLPVPFDSMGDIERGVLRCGSKIIVFLVSKEQNITVIHLYEVDTETLSMIKLTENPLDFFVFSPNSIIADRGFIYFYGSFYLAYYDVEYDIWNTVGHDIQFENYYLKQIESVCPIRFEAGLNSFMSP